MSLVRLMSVLGLLVWALTAGAVPGQDAPAPEAKAPPDSREGDRGEAGPGGYRRGWRPRSPAENDAEVVAFAKQSLPDIHERIIEYQRDNPTRARTLIRQVYWLMQQAGRYPAEVRPAVIARFKALYEIREALAHVRETEDPAARTELSVTLKRLVGEHFDHDQTLREYEVKDLARRLGELKAQVAERREDRAKVIEEKLEALLRPREATQPAAGSAPPKAPDGQVRPPLRPGLPTEPSRSGRTASRPHGPGFPSYRLTDDQQERAIAFAKEHFPDQHQRILEYQKTRPERAAGLIRWMSGMLHESLRYPPEVRPAVIGRNRLYLDIGRTVRQYREAKDPADRDRLKAELRDLIGRQFDFDQTVKEHDVKRLARRLAELKEQLRQHQQDRPKIIAQRLADLLRPPTTSAPAPAPAPPAGPFPGPITTPAP